MKLIEHVAEHNEAARKLADMDLPADAVKDTLESMTGALEVKARSVAGFILGVEADARARREHAEKVLAKAKAEENRAASMREYLHYCMISAGITEIKGPEFTLRIRDNPAKVVVDRDESVPADYWVDVPATQRLDKQLVKQAIKDGYDVPGCRLERGTRLEVK